MLHFLDRLSPLRHCYNLVPFRLAKALGDLTLALHLSALVVIFPGVLSAAEDPETPDMLIADFEGPDYGGWTAAGTAFGAAPARGTLPNQMGVAGYRGEGLVNSFVGGDDSQGSLLSPPFKVSRRQIHFLIGGGHHPGKTCVNLLVDGRVLRTATGKSTGPNDTESLEPHTWDVADLLGKQAQIEILDRQTGGWGHINVDHLVQSDRPLQKLDERAELLARAAASVDRLRRRVVGDPERPVFHLLPPAGWMNDPNGLLHHRGIYHVFYQHNPYGDAWGHMHWGHARSRDLVFWEHLPIALWPSKRDREDHVFSGSATLDKQGRPLLFYTSIGPRDPEQWAALPADDELLSWKKHPKNPLLTEKLHGSTKVHEWRDPYVFLHAGHHYLVCGGNLNANQGAQAAVFLYRAENDDLTQWKYLHPLFIHPDKDVKNIECPIFFELSGKWVLIVSPHRAAEWFTGDLDDNLRFQSTKNGVLDRGSVYAPSVFQLDAGRRVLFGWVRDFPAGKGWNGCLTLPRELTLAPDGALLQSPVAELDRLRLPAIPNIDPASPRPLLPPASDAAETAAKTAVTPAATPASQPSPDYRALEVHASLDLNGAQECGFDLQNPGEPTPQAKIRFDGRHITLNGLSVPLPGEERPAIDLRLYLDHSVLEIYTADGQLALTRVLPTPAPTATSINPTWTFTSTPSAAANGPATLKKFQAWPLKSIWPPAKN